MRQLPGRFGEFGSSAGSCRSIIFAPRSSHAAREKGFGWLSRPQHRAFLELGSRSRSLCTLTSQLRDGTTNSPLEHLLIHSQLLSSPHDRNLVVWGSIHSVCNPLASEPHGSVLGMMVPLVACYFMPGTCRAIRHVQQIPEKWLQLIGLRLTQGGSLGMQG